MTRCFFLNNQLSFADLIVWQASGLFLRVGQYVRPIFMICFFPQIRGCLKTVQKTLPSTIEVFILLTFILLFSLVFFVFLLKTTYVTILMTK
jgi:hypothetical protein